MSEWQELLQVSKKEALRFFYHGLRETASAQPLSQQEALHVASVLAHYAQTSCESTNALPAPRDLTQVFDTFILPLEVQNDVELLQTAGAQCLFLLGFFPQQMRHKHNLSWYEKFGRAFYMRASYYSNGPEQSKTLLKMSKNFHPWTLACQELRQNLWEARFLLPDPKPPS